MLGTVSALLVGACGDSAAPQGNPFPYVPPTDGDGDLSGDLSGDGDGLGPVTDELPCAVKDILADKCSLCHGADPDYNAPMSLTTRADFLATSSKDPSKKIYEQVTTRIHEVDATLRMPPVAQPTLTEQEIATLDTWLNAGVPANTVSCDPVGDGTGDSSGDGAGDASGDGAGDTSGDASGDASGDTSGDGGDGTHTPCPDGNCNPDRTGLDCYKLTAHDADAAYDFKGDNPKYQVGTATDDYYNFTFNAPWQGEAYGILLRPIIDNKDVIHHWLLFRGDGPVQNGAVRSSNGTHPEGELVHGWAPGGDMIDFRDYGDLGFEFVQGTNFTVEFHYNSSDPNAEDASGVEVCVVKEKPANLAGVSWLGTDAILGTSATGTCDPISNQPINIISISPHMHVKGKHMTAVINRAGGGTEKIHDGDFDFNNQTWYPAEHTLMPGDTITTTCTYTAFSRFGTETSSEMCYLFTVHWPNGALTNGDTSIHGKNSCLRAF